MDSDRIKGKAEEIKGKVKEKAGEWTGNRKTQAEGLADQVKGKTQNAVGKMKDAGRDMVEEAKRKMPPRDVRHETIHTHDETAGREDLDRKDKDEDKNKDEAA